MHVRDARGVEARDVERGEPEAAVEHAVHIRHLRGVPARDVERGEPVAEGERLMHVRDARGVPSRDVECRERGAFVEHLTHVRDARGVEPVEVRLFEVPAAVEPITCRLRADALVDGGHARDAAVVLEKPRLVLDARLHLGDRAAVEGVAGGGGLGPPVEAGGAVGVPYGEGLLPLEGEVDPGEREGPLGGGAVLDGHGYPFLPVSCLCHGTRARPPCGCGPAAAGTAVRLPPCGRARICSMRAS